MTNRPPENLEYLAAALNTYLGIKETSIEQNKPDQYAVKMAYCIDGQSHDISLEQTPSKYNLEIKNYFSQKPLRKFVDSMKGKKDATFCAGTDNKPSIKFSLKPTELERFFYQLERTHLENTENPNEVYKKYVY